MSFLSLINSYDDAWKAVIMPPRQDYSLSNLGIFHPFPALPNLKQALLNSIPETTESKDLTLSSRTAEDILLSAPTTSNPTSKAPALAWYIYMVAVAPESKLSSIWT